MSKEHEVVELINSTKYVGMIAIWISGLSDDQQDWYEMTGPGGTRIDAFTQGHQLALWIHIAIPTNVMC